MLPSLRIVSFNVLPRAYQLVADWATQHGHRVVLVVTTPGAEGARYRQGYQDLIAALSPDQDVLITRRMRKTAVPVISSLQPDLIISATFPHRIPPEITAIPRYGALNLHPAPLPRGRGPNPTRLIYEGDLTAVGSVHRIVPEFDAGPILGQRQRQLPEDLTEMTIYSTWAGLLHEALEEAVTRAVAGEPGEPQDEARATYAAPFTEDEAWLRWEEPGLAIQRRVAALNLGAPMARATIDGQEVPVAAVKARRLPHPPGPPGTLVSQENGHYTISVADGVVELVPRTDQPVPG